MKTNHIFCITAIFFSLMGSVSAAAGEVKKQIIEGTQGYRDEINRAAEPYLGPQRSGEQVYHYRCGGCHAKTTQGAPMPGDDIEWGMRARQGMDILMEHAINGYRKGFMPARGGCDNCSDDEIKAAVVYMLNKSGIKVPE